jgi:catechol 2,3-dioxygenase-like lactoylglutathione lyase family enzyme
MIIDHIGFVVSNYDKSKTFYLKCLAPLKIELVMEIDGWAGFGKNQKPEFWFGAYGVAHKPIHIAFTAESREQVNQFYTAALEAGGKDNGAPGIREIYHPNYYGAFVFDPDGHNIEAVCHKPEESA